MGKYSLIVSSEDSKEVSVILDEEIDNFASAIRAIGKDFPTVGIGDTACDEAIVNEVYRKIHG